MALTDNQVDLLGRRPNEALRRWPQLDDRQKWIAFASLGRHYGDAFALQFMKNAAAHKKPADSIDIVSGPTFNAASLTSAGFRRSGNSDGAEVWVHPTGKEVWVLPQARAVEPPPIPPPVNRPAVPEEDVDVQDARAMVAQLEAQGRALKARYDKLMSGPRGADWKRQAMELWLDNFDFGNHLATVIDNDFPAWTQDQDAAGISKLAEIKNRANGLFGSISPEQAEALEKLDTDGSLMREALRKRGRDRLF